MQAQSQTQAWSHGDRQTTTAEYSWAIGSGVQRGVELSNVVPKPEGMAGIS